MLIEASCRKAIEHYYATLEELVKQEISHEQGLRPAFQNLLAAVGKRLAESWFPESTRENEMDRQ